MIKLSEDYHLGKSGLNYIIMHTLCGSMAYFFNSIKGDAKILCSKCKAATPKGIIKKYKFIVAENSWYVLQ